MTLHRTSIFLNPAHQAQLSEISKVEGLPVSALVRIAISEYLKRTARPARVAAKPRHEPVIAPF